DQRPAKRLRCSPSMSNLRCYLKRAELNQMCASYLLFLHLEGSSIMLLSWLRPWTKPNPQASGRNGRTKTRHRGPRSSLGVEGLETRILMAYRTITGFGNNIAHPTWGNSHTDLVRIAPAAYANGVNSPSGAGRPSARQISNNISDQTDPGNRSEDITTINQQRLSDFIYVFGQFLDHDLDLTGGATPAE